MAVASGSPDKHNPVAGILWMIGAACCFAASLSLVKALQDDGMTPFQAVLFRQVFGLVIFIPVILRVGVTSQKRRYRIVIACGLFSVFSACVQGIIPWF